MKTGAFKAMSETFPGPTHYKRALRALKVVKPDVNIKNVRNRERKLTAVSMDTLMKALTVPISELLTLYTSTLKTLHPFEATVADLTVTAREKKGHQSLATILANLKALRATTSRVAKEYASRGTNAESAAEAKLLLEEGTKKLEELFEHRYVGEPRCCCLLFAALTASQLFSPSPEAVSFTELVELQKDLRRIPVVELDTPTVVLVGAPNVGKSSIVRVVSSGTPEVRARACPHVTPFFHDSCAFFLCCCR